jgi:hypothetical protein
MYTIVTMFLYRGWLKKAANWLVNVVVACAFESPFVLRLEHNWSKTYPFNHPMVPWRPLGINRNHKKEYLWYNPFWLPGAACKQMFTLKPTSRAHSMPLSKYLQPTFSTYGSLELTFATSQYGKEILTWSNPASRISWKESRVTKVE